VGEGGGRGRNIRDMMGKLLGQMRREKLLLALLFALPVLVVYLPEERQRLHLLVDWSTIGALAGLMLLSRALEESGCLFRADRTILLKLRTERSLALFLILFAAALSTVITNDVALFITIPLTLGLRLMARLPLARLVVFQALAVNVGSSLSPIGNPQNLYLWQRSGASFLDFTWAMAPLAGGLMLLLLAFVPLAYRTRTMMLAEVGASPATTPRLLWALPAYLPFVWLVEAGWALPGALGLLALFAIMRPRLVMGVDWPLLLVFVLMFVNLGLLARLGPLAGVFQALPDTSVALYLAGAGLSQLISNVPVAIFLAEFGQDWRALAWGASVGGFGLAIGSMANLIALRLAREPGIWLEFHRWSLPMLIAAAGLGWLML